MLYSCLLKCYALLPYNSCFANGSQTLSIFYVFLPIHPASRSWPQIARSNNLMLCGFDYRSKEKIFLTVLIYFTKLSTRKKSWSAADFFYSWPPSYLKSASLSSKSVTRCLLISELITFYLLINSLAHSFLIQRPLQNCWQYASLWGIWLQRIIEPLIWLLTIYLLQLASVCSRLSKYL